MNDEKKYIVPIYVISNTKAKEFNGTGFIVGNLLFTAGHVISNEGAVFILFEGTEYKLEKLIYCEYDDNFVSIKRDLAIFELNMIKGQLSFSNKTLDDGASCELYGYSYNDENKCLCIDTNDKISFRSHAYSSRPNKLNNCFSFTPPGKKGNSGCPIFSPDGKIIGMHTSSISYHNRELEGIAITSKYIMHILNQLKQ